VVRNSLFARSHFSWHHHNTKGHQAKNWECIYMSVCSVVVVVVVRLVDRSARTTERQSNKNTINCSPLCKI
jgi:hypothetical protein